MTSASRLLLVDLTPLLPGGENGGAKWLTIELLRHLPAKLPDWRITLLTTARNQEQLAQLFPDYGRILTIDESGRVAHIDPAHLATGERASVLFCPFTAPFHASPAVPTVSTVHDLQFHAYPQFFTEAQRNERAGHMADTARIADVIICVSEHVARDVKAYTGLPDGRVTWIHNSLPFRLGRRADGDDAAVLNRWGLARNRYLIFPANTWRHKNHAMLLVAFGMYLAEHPASDLKLVCTGVSDSPEGRALRSAIEKMGLDGRIVLPGFLPEDELADLMGSARALIFPSLFEGFGMPVVEAMAAGLPVLCSNTTSLPEIAGDAALLFDPRQPASIVAAIARIEDEPDLAANLIEKGRRRVAEIGDADKMAASYAAIFARLADKPAPGPIVVTRTRLRRFAGRAYRSLRYRLGRLLGRHP